jgi:hypothetical protein
VELLAAVPEVLEIQAQGMLEGLVRIWVAGRCQLGQDDLRDLARQPLEALEQAQVLLKALDEEAQEGFWRWLKVLLAEAGLKPSSHGRMYLKLWGSARQLHEAFCPPPTITEDAARVGAEIREAIAPGGRVLAAPAKQSALPGISPLAHYPTEMTRTSPFFPVSRTARAAVEGVYIRDMAIAAGPWGEILYTGPKLTVYDEDILVGLLALLSDPAQRLVEQVQTKSKTEGGELVQEETRTTFMFKGHLRQLLMVSLGGRRHPSKKDYENATSSLKRLAGAIMELRLNQKDQTKGGKARTFRKKYIHNILSAVIHDERSNEIAIAINPYFYKTFADKHVTYFDVAARNSLDGHVAKALYRFLRSQAPKSDGEVYHGSPATLAVAINLDPGLEPRVKNQSLKRGLAELERVGLILPPAWNRERVKIRMQPPQLGVSGAAGTAPGLPGHS